MTNITNLDTHTGHFHRILVTAALPYVNNIPHLGNLIPIISADVYSRYLKYVRKVPCIFVCGTDEHGTATETKALEEGLTPKEICDKYHAIQKEAYDWFLCDFDCFGRTSDKENYEVATDIFNKLDKNGFILEKEIEQLKCEVHGFLADRFVTGNCPKCGYDNAKGDQCESCGEMLNATELVNPKCSICKKTPFKEKTNHLFVDLPKIEPELKEWIDSVKVHWENNAVQMTEGYMKEGLKPRCITRDLKWGIPVPKKGFENKVFYCWFDAPIGYIGITKKAMPESWKMWWHEPKNTRLVQFLGKDNIPFHAIMFPSFLIGSKDNYTLVDTMPSNEYINYEGGMFSKSRGIGIFADSAMDTGIRADIWRYYIMMRRPEKSDTDFEWNDFQAKINNELVANFGNLVNRIVTFSNRFLNSVINVSSLSDEDKKFLDMIKAEEQKYFELMDNMQIKDALKQLMHISKLGNIYFQDNKPWELVKSDYDECAKKICVLCNIVKLLAKISSPYMPKVSEDIYHMLGTKDEGILHRFNIKEGKILFGKLEDENRDKFKEKYAGKRKEETNKNAQTETKEQKNNSSILDIRICKILSVENHPSADKLYILKIDDGSGVDRQLVAGLRQYISPDYLLGQTVCFLANLKPAMLRGIESQGMILAAEKDGIVDLLFANGLKPGNKASFIDGESKPQIEFNDFTQFDIRTNDKKEITCDGHILKSGHVIIKTDKVSGNAKVR